MLQLQEEAIVLSEDYLFHHTVVFYHFKQLYDVEITVQFVFSLVELVVALCRFDALELLLPAAVSASEEVHDSLACVVSESTLIQDQVVDVVELMGFWPVTNKLLLLDLHISHEFLLIFLLVALNFL